MHYDGREAIMLINKDTGTLQDEIPENMEVCLCIDCIRTNMSSMANLRAHISIPGAGSLDFLIQPGQLWETVKYLPKNATTYSVGSGNRVGVFAITVFQGYALCEVHMIDRTQKEKPSRRV
jgi:hypothetical protein